MDLIVWWNENKDVYNFREEEKPGVQRQNIVRFVGENEMTNVIRDRGNCGYVFQPSTFIITHTRSLNLIFFP